MNGISCWICLTSATSALQLAPLQWQNELNKDQEKNVSQPNRDPWWIWPRECFRSCLLQLHQTRGWPRMDIKILENLLEVTIDRGNLRTRHLPGYSKEDYGRSWSSQEWKSGAVEHDRSGETWVNFLECIAKSWPSSWGTSSRRKCAFRKVRRDDSRLELGNLRQWITKERQIPKISSMGSDAAEFVNKVQRPSARQTEKDVERCRIRWRAFNNMENVQGYNVKCGDIHGKEFLNYSKCCQESWRAHVETNVRCHRAVGEKPGRNQWPGQNSVGKVFLDTSVTDWWWNSHQSPTHKRSMSSRILCCASERFFNIPIPTKLERTELQEPDPRKATETMILSMESRLNSSGTSSQDSHNVAALW